MIQVKNISKKYIQYDEEVEVLKGLSLDVKEGESVALLGHSGSGKSTLLNCLGLLDKPDSGDILIDGQSMLQKSEADRAKFRLSKLGFVFQFHHLIPELTTFENIMLPASLAKNNAEDRAVKLLDRVGLSRKKDALTWQLSGGEQQRVALIRGLINSPKVLFTDEVTGNLDSLRSLEIIEMLGELRESEDLTIVSVTHNEEHAKHYNQAYRLVDGVLQSIAR
ncbi:UNVERIFIED_CONTAM: hypothetical protein GTU68_049344 [Idotea baltica]|nr:hypothetical protein [Idotea baltica]